MTNELVRDLWIEEKLKSLPAGLRILDAGAGEMPYKKFCSHLIYVSQDAANYQHKSNAHGLHMNEWNYGKLDIVCDICQIPESDASFDAVLCTEVLEHLPNPYLALKEFQRLIKSNGYLILTAPFCSMTHFAPHHYCTGFNRFYYEKHLTDLGFEILELKTNGNYFDYLKQEINRIYYIAEKYGNGKPRFLERKALGVVHRMLKRFSENDKGSDELLSFGYHVLARKK
ncbi:MAG: class I SAM-dependent methyltransferase [Bacteroidia bacterium]|nr:class I SAM-dependent methyltransferase [Bacteroidia bacterium]